MAVCCSAGALSRLYVEPGSSPYTWDSNSETYEFLHESLQMRGMIIHPNGIRGTRSRTSERARLGPYVVAGSILMNPDPAMLDLWLPRMLGAAASGTTFALAETLPSFAVLMDRVANTFEYKDCYVSRWTLRGQSNQYGNPQPLLLALEIIGKSRTKGTAVPSVNLSTASNTQPYIFEDMTLTMQSSSRQVMNFVMIGNNFVRPRFTNSLYATDICTYDRHIMFSCTVPYCSDNADLLDQTVAGAAATLALTNGTVSMSAALGNLKVPTEDPTVRGKTEILVPISGEVFQVTTTKEIVVTNDSTV